MCVDEVMPKMSVVVNRDSDLRPVLMVINRGRKKLEVKYTHSPLGDSYQLDFSGHRDVLPTLTEIMTMTDAKRIDRIGTIEVIELIKLIEEIEKIKKIEEIEEISKISAVPQTSRGLIRNPFFEKGLDPWYVQGTVLWGSGMKISPVGFSAQFPTNTTGYIQQGFYIPIGVDWFTEFYFIMTSVTVGSRIIVYYYYSDGTSSNEVFTQLISEAFEKKVMSPTAGKTLIAVRFYHDVAVSEETFIGEILMVF